MSETTTASDWVEANQRCLMAELAVLRLFLDRSRDNASAAVDPRSPAHEELGDARAAMPAPSALDTLCALFGL